MDITRYTTLRAHGAARKLSIALTAIKTPRNIANAHHILELAEAATRRWPKLDMRQTASPWDARTQYSFTLEARRSEPLRSLATEQFIARMLGDERHVYQLHQRMRAVARPADSFPVSIHVPMPNSDFTYGIALHEFGHLATHDTYTPTSNANELLAANWVLDNARYWAPALTDSVMIGLWSRVNVKDEFAMPMADFVAFGERVEAREQRG